MTGQPVYRESAWDTRIDSLGGNIVSTDEDLFRDFLRDFIEMREDCDIDCQKNGSQLTLIATLMGAAYGLIGLNALFMFIGVWRYELRVCSIYCTFCACVTQLALMIAVGALLFTKYNKVCARSMVETAPPMMWHMADDFFMTTFCWGTSFVTLFAFLACGLCQAMREQK